MRRLTKPRPLFSLDEIERLLIPALTLLAVHAAAAVGAFFWFAGHEELSPSSWRATLNGTEWRRYEVTLTNYTFSQACERCCINGRVTNGRNQRLGKPAWERNVQYVVHTRPALAHSEVGRKCTKPKLARTCEPTPCTIPGGVWCWNSTCGAGKLLWRHPHEEAAELHSQASTNVLVGPLLMLPAAILDLYLAGRLSHRLLFSAWHYRYRSPRLQSATSSGAELSLSRGEGAGTPRDTPQNPFRSF